MIKPLVIPILLGMVSFNALADTCEAPDPTGEYQLIFEENFDGDTLDYNRWTPAFLWGPSHIINNETQYYVNPAIQSFASNAWSDYNPFSLSEGVLTIQAIKAPFDRTQLYLTRSVYSANTAELLWRVPEGAALYEVYRDGVLQGTATEGSFLQTDLRDSIDYAYEVVALDSEGNQISTAQLTVNTVDRYTPGTEKPFELGLTAKIYGSRVAEINWLSPNRSSHYEIYRDGELHRTLHGADYKSLFESGLVEGQDYEYRVVAYDRCDEEIIEQTITVNTGDGISPAAELSDRLVIKSSVSSVKTVDLSWNAVVGARTYDIYDNEVFVANIGGRSLFVDDLVPGFDRKFRVVALDTDGTVLDETTRVVNTADNSFALNRQPFLSGIITSYNSLRFKYGRVEARARMPAGKGLWSAFWLLNAYYKQDQPEDPEIDIIEAIGDRTTTANHAYHYATDPDGDGFYNGRDSTEMRAVIDDFSADFHTYRVDWEEGLIVWYVDDIETGRVEGDQVSSEQMYLIANLAVGGNFPGPADETTPFPARFEIDYIRVYQR